MAQIERSEFNSVPVYIVANAMPNKVVTQVRHLRGPPQVMPPVPPPVPLRTDWHCVSCIC
jgi:hypothetical protein